MANTWQFYGRQAYMGSLLETMRSGQWFFGEITGRRRIGKTTLIRQALATVGREITGAREVLLVEMPDSTVDDVVSEFRTAVLQAGLENKSAGIAQVRDLPGMATSISSLCRAGVIVVLDELQVCHRGPLRGFPSLLKQRIDRLHDAKGGLIVMGSVQTEMEALLHDRRTPLFGRTTFNMKVGPWDLKTVFEVCSDQQVSDPSRWLTLWTLFGGVPKYWNLFSLTEGPDPDHDWSEWTEDLCARLFLRLDAPLRNEDEVLLGRELRGNYLSLFKMIATRGECSHAELRDTLPGLSSVGPYLTSLSGDLGLVEKEMPVFAGDSTRNTRYIVADPFMRAWLAAVRPQSGTDARHLREKHRHACCRGSALWKELLPSEWYAKPAKRLPVRVPEISL